MSLLRKGPSGWIKLSATVALALSVSWGRGVELDTSTDRVKTELNPGFKQIGVIKPRGAAEIQGSNWTLGCETLDRDFAIYDAYKAYILPLGICRFTIDVPGPNDLEANGDLLDWEYTFERAGRPAAQVSKRLLSWSDTYGVDIVEGEDDILILASAAVIDLVCHDNRQH
jgi:hypothetical protein